MPAVRRTAVVLILLVPLTMASAGCGEVRDRLDDVRDTADQVTDRVRFCLALARTLHAIESGSPATAADAAEEAFATVPDNMADDARQVVEAVRRSLAGDAGLHDADVRGAARQLEERTRVLCDPTSS